MIFSLDGATPSDYTDDDLRIAEIAAQIQRENERWWGEHCHRCGQAWQWDGEDEVSRYCPECKR